MFTDIVVVSDQKRNQKNRTATGFLRSLTSSLDYGIKNRRTEGRSVHANKNHKIMSFLNKETARIYRISVDDYQKHFDGQHTLYYAGNGDSRATHTAATVDIDCQKSGGKGSHEGAVEFAEYLKSGIFPGMYHETSNGGVGVNGLLIVSKDGLGNEEINKRYKRLEMYLNRLATEGGFDVERIEIKGTLPEIEWSDRRQCTSFKAGMLAKLPKNKDRFEDWTKTTVVSAERLARLPIIWAMQQEALTPKPKKVKPTSPTINLMASVAGSISGEHVSDDERRHMATEYRDVGLSLLGKDGLKLTTRARVTGDDLGIMLGLVKFFTNNMETNGALPTKRFKTLWECLYEKGQINRAWNCNRFKAMRDLLSSLGLIDWKESTFQVGHYEQGEYKKGKAAKWKGSAELMGLLDLCLSKEEERGESILCTNKDNSQNVTKTSDHRTAHEVIRTLAQCAKNDIQKPHEVISDHKSYRLFYLYSVPEYRIAA